MAALALAGCATRAPGRPGPVEGAVTQPFEDVGLLRGEIPEVLKAAAAGPYELASPADCTKIAAEISALNGVLGADIDASSAKGDRGPTKLFVAALRGALGLPFRGVVRQISGAERREEERADAVLAGVSRRAFLKGAARAAGCPPLPLPAG
jgi:hypothetical protein